MSLPVINTIPSTGQTASTQVLQLLDQLKHYLPSQTPIREFIHHNTLHAFQHMRFFDAIFNAGQIFGYQVTLEMEDFRTMYATGRIKESNLRRVLIKEKGPENLFEWENRMLHTSYDTQVEPRIGQLRSLWKKNCAFNIDDKVHPLLFRILAAYLDQGIATERFPLHPDGLLASIRQLEGTSWISFFKTTRVKALVRDTTYTLDQLLLQLVGDEKYIEQYVYDQQFAHHGWSGLVTSIEAAPKTLYDQRSITLHDMVYLECLLEMDVLEQHCSSRWKPIAHLTDQAPVNLFDPVPVTEWQEVLRLWQLAFEWTYYDEVLTGIQISQKHASTVQDTTPGFQALFCIDERECSLRRHVESLDPNCETLGTPGFFGVEFYFQQDGGAYMDKLCPAPVFPNYLIKETKTAGLRKGEWSYKNLWKSFWGNTLGASLLGIPAVLKTVQMLFTPRMSPAISDAFAHMQPSSVLTIENTDPSDKENGLQIGFTLDEMSTRVENVLRGIGLVSGFAPIIYAIAHGSSSANNPHHSAHDCGACSGRPGSVNARVFAFMANHDGVRSALRSRGIDIPKQTRFIGGLHDTAADQIAFYDEHDLPKAIQSLHISNKVVFERALDLNAKERSRRFASIPTKDELKHIRQNILKRSVSMFEPRPELGHGTNSLCIVGRRALSKNLFLDRRAFMNSYDYRLDPEGHILTNVMKPIGLVCGGINLEYYFSRVDNQKFGAGTKLPHNVIGLVGVSNSCDGDLRPGLPLQMIEVHDPVRLLVMVEHRPEIVLKAIQSAPAIYEWYINDWVQLIAVNPYDHQFYYFKNGAFTLYTPLIQELNKMEDLSSFIETAQEMKSNYIVDATEENLPVYLLN